MIGSGPGQRIVVYRTGFLGDTLCALPAFRLIRRACPDAQLTLLADASPFQQDFIDQVLTPLEIFDRYESYRATRGLRSAWNLFRKLRSLQPDMLIALPQAIQTIRSRRLYRRLFRAAGIRHTLGMALTDPVLDWYPNEADRLVKLLNDEGIPGSKPAYDIPVNLPAVENMRRRLAPRIDLNRPYLVFCGGGKTSSQRWMSDRYAEVLSEVERRCGVQLLAIGSPAELERYSQEILPHCPGLQLVSPPLSLAELLELLRGAVAYLGNDTGPMHLAATVGCPAVVVMSARNYPGEWDPDVEPRLVIRHRTPCEGCVITDCIVEQHRCMTEITTVDVIAQAVPFIQSVLQVGRCPL